MFLADVTLFPNTEPWETIFRKSWINLNVLGMFGNEGFQINLAGLLIVLIVGLAATVITERLAGERPGKNMLAAVLITFFGAYVFGQFVALPFDTKVEQVPLVAALLGSIVFGVFFVLIGKAVRPKAK
jgi:drug/metabolite transporter (DMT)-like permease